MHIFTRDEPDGWPEGGIDWITTSGFLARIKFTQEFTAADSGDLMWQTRTFLDDNGLTTAEEVFYVTSM